MVKGYDSASMTVLHKELNISRGAMYRYFPSKDDLFIAVIDKYLFGVIDRLHPNFGQEDVTVADRIDLSYKHLLKVAKFFDGIDNMDIKFFNFTALMIQAAKRYPGFIEKLRSYKQDTIREWEKAILKSIEKKEIKEDVDVKLLALFFSKSITYLDNWDEGGKCFVKGVKKSKKMVNYIYSLIEK